MQKALQYRKRRAYLEKENLLKHTVIIFSSDHGEMMGDHGLSQKTSPYWQASRVPLYMRHPDYPGRMDHDCLVESIDITGTVLDAAGLDPTDSLGRPWPSGQDAVPTRSLMPVISGKIGDHREFTFSESYGLWEMIESRNFKYVRDLPTECSKNGSDTLWDLRSDPDEKTNVASEEAYQDAPSIIMQNRKTCFIGSGNTQWVPQASPSSSPTQPARKSGGSGFTP